MSIAGKSTIKAKPRKVRYRLRMRNDLFLSLLNRIKQSRIIACISKPWRFNYLVMWKR